MARARGAVQIPDLTSLDFPAFETGSWTLNPTIVNTGSFTLGTVYNNFYLHVGNLCVAYFDFSGTFSGINAGSYVRIDPPVPMNGNQLLSGYGWYTITSTNSLPLMVAANSGFLQIYMNNYLVDSYSTSSNRFIRGSIMYRTT